MAVKQQVASHQQSAAQSAVPTASVSSCPCVIQADHVQGALERAEANWYYCLLGDVGSQCAELGVLF